MTSPAALFTPPYVPTPPQPDQGWFAYFDQHRDLYMAGQVYPWTCSVCASTWVLQASGLEPNAAREGVAYELGYPSCVNPAVGLANIQCAVNLFEAHGVPTYQEWVGWDRAYALCEQTTGLLNSTRWYHFVGIRGVRNGNLWVANSAPGYQGIVDDVTPGQFQAWAGSWQIVWLEH